MKTKREDASLEPRLLPRTDRVNDSLENSTNMQIFPLLPFSSNPLPYSTGSVASSGLWYLKLIFSAAFSSGFHFHL